MPIIKAKNRLPQGLGLVEVILATALFGLFATALIGLLMNSYGSDIQANQRDIALLHAQEGIEATWSIRRQAWNFLVNGTYGLDNANGYWEFFGTADTLPGGYTRIVTIADACRDGSNNIIDCSGFGAMVDLNTKKITVEVFYTSINGVSNSVALVAYLTTWQTKDFVQTDWVGGSGQSQWSDNTKYDSDDGNLNVATSGQVTLAALASGGCGSKIWPFTTATDYNYDPLKIEVTLGAAQLVNSGGVGSCAGTPTACTAYPDQPSCQAQSGCSWSTGGGSCGNVGSCSAATGGACNSCIAAGCTKQGKNCNGTLNCSTYTDQTNCQLCNQCVWTPGVGSCAGTPTACTAYPDQPSCQAQSGCSWSGGSSYPTDNPTISPIISYTASNLDVWSLFKETATKNGGEIYYQLSDDDGATWRYWNGSTWTVAGTTDYNIATIINSNIGSFSTTTGKMMFKAFLASDGAQQIQLDNIQIGWGQTGGVGGYATFGHLVSSAFNMGNVASVNIVEWDETVSSCTPKCQIKLQVRTAPDAGGSPGSWTSWYGASGVGTYFISSSGAIIPTDLNFNQWLQYRAELNGDGSDTPILEEVRINYLP